MSVRIGWEVDKAAVAGFAIAKWVWNSDLLLIRVLITSNYATVLLRLTAPLTLSDTYPASPLHPPTRDHNILKQIQKWAVWRQAVHDYCRYWRSRNESVCQLFANWNGTKRSRTLSRATPPPKCSERINWIAHSDLIMACINNSRHHHQKTITNWRI